MSETWGRPLGGSEKYLWLIDRACPFNFLVHADVQGGNILLTAEGPKLLDAEIAHVGDPAFDIGTLMAHVLLAGVGGGRAAWAGEACEVLWSHYGSQLEDLQVSRSRADAFAAIEMRSVVPESGAAPSPRTIIATP